MSKIITKAKMTTVILLVLLVSCATQPIPYPRASMPLASEQLLIQSAAHWDILAKNESDFILKELAQAPSLFLREKAKNASPFEQAYHEMLISNLVQNGAKVFTKPTGSSLALSYDIQTVKHNKEDLQKLRPGSITAFILSASILNNLTNWDDPKEALIPFTIGLEFLNALSSDTYAEITEVIINTRLSNGDQIVTANSRVYYFNESDLQNYNQGRPFQVVSSGQVAQ